MTSGRGEGGREAHQAVLERAGTPGTRDTGIGMATVASRTRSAPKTTGISRTEGTIRTDSVTRTTGVSRTDDTGTCVRARALARELEKGAPLSL